MKKTIVILLVISSLFMVMSSCGKYDDGPSFSLRTKKARLAGTWKIEELKVNGEIFNMNDISEGVEISSFVFDKDGSGKMNLSAMGFQLPLQYSWEFTNSKENLKITFKEISGIPGYEIEMPFNSLELEILRLTNKEFWSKDVSPDNQDFRAEIKLKKDK